MKRLLTLFMFLSIALTPVLYGCAPAPPGEIVPTDGKTDQTAVTNAVSEMINVHNVVAIGGLNDSTFALAAGPIAQTAGIPVVTAGATLLKPPGQSGD